MGDTSDVKPEWWQRNEALREEMDLPTYEPPRFEDGTYTHDVTSELERALDCELQFVGLDPRYPEDWYVRIDGDTAFRIGRRRDTNGNTVYELESAAFESKVREYVD